MSDPRYAQLAQLLVGHSTKLGPEDRVLIESTHVPPAMVSALIEESTAAGALTLVETTDTSVLRAWLRAGAPEQFHLRTKLQGELELARMEKMTAYIGLRGSNNITGLEDVPLLATMFYEANLQKPVHFERRATHTRWCEVHWPTPAMAQLAGMSTEAFEDFFFQVCLADYVAMERAVKPLRELMARTDRVRILGPDTDLRFSIKGIPAVPCTGQYNVPDGECFTAPVLDSVEGHIHFNSGTIYRGAPFDDIRLTFEKGKVVDHHCSNPDGFGGILECDQGSRYVGEFALAFHPLIHTPMRDVLFDEKIRGSLHLALGQSYELADNGNRSRIHWDLVLRQEEGGEVFFDDVLIRKDGRFVLKALKGLNPENLGGKAPSPAEQTKVSKDKGRIAMKNSSEPVRRRSKSR